MLVVLIAHLALMASSLHDVLMHPEATGHDQQATFADETGTSHVALAEPDSGQHCGVVWTVLERQPTLLPLIWLTFSAPTLAAPTRAACRPTPRALGPPIRADSQALLQVLLL
jgi:hypothetical protein